MCFSRQAQEAAARASNAPRDDQDLDKVLASLGVAPVSGEAAVAGGVGWGCQEGTCVGCGKWFLLYC